jgi:DNA repair ATPase RecN
MKEMSQPYGNICHHPFTANCLAAMHILKFLQINNGEDTQSKVKPLTDEECNIEIAQMLSGAVSDSV